MASIRKHRGKWQVQIRRLGSPATSKSFINRKDAENWARQTEVQIDQKSLPQDPRQLARYTLGELVVRFRYAHFIILLLMRRFQFTLGTLADGNLCCVGYLMTHSLSTD
jgi:hypothetical protein